jgi:hypothetical protein
MNPKKETAKYHTIVITEIKPDDSYTFEEEITGIIRKRYNESSVYLEFKHGIQDDINNISVCLDWVNKKFGDIGNSTFTIKKNQHEEAGKFIIMSWKNSFLNRLK